MSFHPSKCTVIRIPPQHKKLLQTNYQLHGQTLQIADSSKCLGVTISDDLTCTWGRHIQQITGKGNRTLSFLRRNFKDCTVPVKKTTNIQQWSDQPWSMPPPYGTRSGRNISRCWNKSNGAQVCVTQMVKDLNWESFGDHRRTNRLCMLYRISHNLVDVKPDTYLQDSDRRTRDHAQFFREIDVLENCCVFPSYRRKQDQLSSKGPGPLLEEEETK